MKEPKVFISYSWTDQSHQDLVKYWADRLVADGVDVILDIYDLKEGDDKYVFMESMVTDTSVTHVLVICDGKYAEKANARKAGVGTESQIISGEVYAKVKQSKFIPIVCEFDGMEPILPAFMKTRMWINFSNPEAVNENWEQLVRLLYGKPQHVKPKKGNAPTYITSDVPIPTSEALAKFNSLKQAILQDKKGISHYRRDFIDSCISYADELRVRERPSVESIGEKILEDCGKLKSIRDHLCNWVLLEAEITDSEIFSEALINVLEKLRELKSRPPEIYSWNDSWFEAHEVFVYETFLYIIAALLKSGAYSTLHEVYSSHYLLDSTNRSAADFERFDCFWGNSETLQSVLAPEGQRLYAPAATLIKQQADRQDLPFSEILQAELLTLLMSFITPWTRWYPQTLHYSSYGSGGYPFFVRAAQHKNFNKLSIITGIMSADELREKVKIGHERIGVKQWHTFHYDRTFWSPMNMENLDTL